MRMKVLTLLLFLLGHPGSDSTQTSQDREGHLKPFGKGKPSQHIPVINDALTAKQFFTTFVKRQQVVLLKGIFKGSSAERLWSDEYFMGLSIPSDHKVLIESRKKENRSAPPVMMPFKQFVAIYNHTEQYMVETVPDFLLKDVQIPQVLQCKDLLKTALVETYMWFSSGGTKSVVHTDAVENLNCVIRGSKKFVIIPPQFKKYVLFDHPEGAYSGIDVDAVDYDIYPGMSQIEYFEHADVEQGDCLYIPFKQIHQVESFDRSIAVNFWWDSFKTSQLNLDECNTNMDPSWNLEMTSLTGFNSIEMSPSMLRETISEILDNGALNLESLLHKMGLTIFSDEDFKSSDYYKPAHSAITKVFEILDSDHDSILEKTDINMLDSDAWQLVSQFFTDLQVAIEEFEQYISTSGKDDTDNDGEEEATDHDEL